MVLTKYHPFYYCVRLSVGFYLWGSCELKFCMIWFFFFFNELFSFWLRNVLFILTVIESYDFWFCFDIEFQVLLLGFIWFWLRFFLDMWLYGMLNISIKFSVRLLQFWLGSGYCCWIRIVMMLVGYTRTK